MGPFPSCSWRNTSVHQGKKAVQTCTAGTPAALCDHVAVMGPKSKTKAKTIDEYLAALTHDKRAALERLRKAIQAAAPRAEECISYQLPAFRLDGRLLVWFGATANHCSFYPGAVVEALKDELEDYDTSKGTIRFQADSPLPARLVRRLVKARIAKSTARHAAGGTARRR
jgi:uncharacterized protein YdhG (YjbR/CyaY superfamily)